MKNNPTSIDRPSIIHALPSRQRFQGTTYALWDAYPTKVLAIEAGEGAETPEGSPEAYPVKALVVDGGMGAGRLRYGVYLAPKSSRKNPHRVKKNPSPLDDLPQTIEIRGNTYHFVESFSSKDALGGARDYIRVNNLQGAIIVGGVTHNKKPVHGVYYFPSKTKKNPPLMVIGNPPFLHNIEKSAFRRGEYVGYAGGVWRIVKWDAKTWRAVKRDSGISLKASTLQELSMLLDQHASQKKNPPSGDIMSDSVHEVRYTHRKDGQPYKHTFKSGVRMVANEDGTITMYHPTKRIHEEFPE